MRVVNRELICFAKEVIVAEATLVGLIPPVLGCNEEVGPRIRVRIILHELRRYRADGGCRDYVARKGRAGEIVDQGRAQPGEVPAPLGIAWYGGRLRHTLDVSEALVISEEEIFVAAKWAAKRPAKLILLQGLYLSGKEVPRIERIVAQELIQHAV